LWIRAIDNSVQRLVNLSNAAHICVMQENSYGPFCVVAIFAPTAPNMPQNLTHIVIRRGGGVDAISCQDMCYELSKIEEQLKANGELYKE
jgi:hypothetical protein